MEEKKLTAPIQIRLEDFIKELDMEELSMLNHMVVERLKLLSQLKTSNQMAAFNLGDHVEFDNGNGQTVKGKIIKFNKRTVSVLTKDNHQWNVHPSFLR
jgi:uncharacterized protein YkvS